MAAVVPPRAPVRRLGSLQPTRKRIKRPLRSHTHGLLARFIHEDAQSMRRVREENPWSRPRTRQTTTRRGGARNPRGVSGAPRCRRPAAAATCCRPAEAGFRSEHAVSTRAHVNNPGLEGFNLTCGRFFQPRVGRLSGHVIAAFCRVVSIRTSDTACSTRLRPSPRHTSTAAASSARSRGDDRSAPTILSRASPARAARLRRRVLCA